jgi:hypothetical protein
VVALAGNLILVSRAPVDREQRGLGHRAIVDHRDTEEDLALTLPVADGSPPAGRLLPSGGDRKVGPPIEQLDDAPIEGVDPASEAAQLGGLAVSHGRPRPSVPG